MVAELRNLATDGNPSCVRIAFPSHMTNRKGSRGTGSEQHCYNHIKCHHQAPEFRCWDEENYKAIHTSYPIRNGEKPTPQHLSIKQEQQDQKKKKKIAQAKSKFTLVRVCNDI